MGYEIPENHHQDMPIRGNRGPEHERPRLGRPEATVAPGWRDISNEGYREYVFPGGDVVRVDGPAALKVTRHEDYVGPGSPDSHRIETLDQENPNRYIPPGWIELRFAGAYKF